MFVKRRAVLWACIASALVVAVVILLTYRWFDDMGRRPEKPVSVPGARLGGNGPGSLVSAVAMPGFVHEVGDYQMHAARIVYRSTTGDGQPTVVSGSVFVPGGAPPAGGWPVVSYGHGTTGLDEPCAPSLSDTLLGGAEAVHILIKKGYAVALADYQGLGAPGVHPWGDSRTAGLNMIDAVRALRATFTWVSKRWAAFGGSQGGGAAWAADEQARTYAPELELIGAVAVSPVTDVTGLVDKAQRGTLTIDQNLVLLALIESLARLHPDINRDDYRHGVVAKYWDALVGCSWSNAHDRADVVKAIQPGAVDPTTSQAADRLRHYLAQWALPQQRLTAPLYVWYGGADTFFDPSWTVDAIQRACALGGTVTVQFEKGKGHGEINYSDQWRWLGDRFAGQPVTNDCA